MQRRMIVHNIIELYKRKCDFSGKEIISMYHSNSPYKIYESKIWNSDKWDPMKYARDYDFKRPFFEQFKELKLNVPKSHNLNINSVNCDYCALVVNCKNCYLCSGNNSEDCAYSIVGLCKDCFDSFWLLKSEQCYENSFSNQNYNVYFSQYSDNCIDSTFLYDCRNCQNCFGCVNLRHKKYHIFNKPYTKKDYQEEIKKYYLGDYNNLEKLKKQFEKFKLKFPRKYARIYNSHNVLGNDIKDTKNCHYCFFTAEGVENCKYIWAGGNNLKDSYDVFDGGTNSELIYESATAGKNLQRVYFSVNIIDNVYNIQYSDTCFSSSSLFGCVGLKHKKYCILNKQYTKQEYEKLIPEIKKHMNEMPYIDKKGRIYKYGEFFPIEFSTFDYNKTFAHEFFPLTKKQANKQGYRWYDKPKSEYKPTIKAKDLPDNIKDINKDIFKEVIECGNVKPPMSNSSLCHSRESGNPVKNSRGGEIAASRTPRNDRGEGEAEMNSCAGSGVFRIIPQELKFYKKMNLPLPHLCPNCRHRERIKQRNPLKLWKRQCMNPSVDETGKRCNNKFQTTYSPERKEIVYCGECYNKEVG